MSASHSTLIHLSYKPIHAKIPRGGRGQEQGKPPCSASLYSDRRILLAVGRFFRDARLALRQVGELLRPLWGWARGPRHEPAENRTRRIEMRLASSTPFVRPSGSASSGFPAAAHLRPDASWERGTPFRQLLHDSRALQRTENITRAGERCCVFGSAAVYVGGLVRIVWGVFCARGAREGSGRAERRLARSADELWDLPLLP